MRAADPYSPVMAIPTRLELRIQQGRISAFFGIEIALMTHELGLAGGWGREIDPEICQCLSRMSSQAVRDGDPIPARFRAGRGFYGSYGDALSLRAADRFC